MGASLVLCQHLPDELYRGHPCPLNSSGQGCPGYMFTRQFNFDRALVCLVRFSA